MPVDIPPIVNQDPEVQAYDEFAGLDQAVEAQQFANATEYGYDEFAGLDEAIAQQQFANATEYGYDEFAGLDEAVAAQAATNGTSSGLQNTRETAGNSDATNAQNKNDWRVRLSLAPHATYLYKAAYSPQNILYPLLQTDGVIFPYTPQIQVNYTANYDGTDLAHSNYKIYQYKNSEVGQVQITGMFTAQDTNEANYLLAVIHFLRSATKMFYGNDSNPKNGVPPPLVYLTGLGEFQFSNHPLLITNFTYSLPSDVDYIRANGFNNIGIDLLNRNNQSSGPAFNGILGGFLSSKLGINGLSLGGIRQVPAPSAVNQNVNTTNSTNSTYVPTKMEIAITLLPIQTRNQVSKQFKLENFANGNLLKEGFW